MKPRFEGALRTYGEIAKDFKRVETGEKQLSDMAAVLDWHIEKEAEASDTSPEAQFRIYSIQQKKQEIMVWLKQELGQLDNPEATRERPKGTRFVREEDGRLYFVRRTKKGRRRIYLTIGDLITDSDWGVRYDLDPKTVSRKTRKFFLIEEAKRRLQEFLDEQITEDTLGRHVPETDGGEAEDEQVRRLKSLQRIYSIMRKERESGIEKGGHISERMVRNFIRKLIIDHGLPCELDKGDIQRDVEEITDFILRKHLRDRGVGVQEEERPDIVVQVTQCVNPFILAKKRRQVSEAKARVKQEPETTIADFVLVVVPSVRGKESVAEWQGKGGLPGGPERYWSPEFQEQVFRAVLKGFFKPEELDLDEFWAKVHPEASEPATTEAEAA